YSLTDQRNSLSGAAKLRSRITKIKSRICCVIRESMFFAEIEGTRRQGFCRFVFSHLSVEVGGNMIRPLEMMGVGGVHHGPRLSQPLAGNIGSPECPGVDACPAQDRDSSGGRVSSESGVIEKLQPDHEMVLSAGEVAAPIAYPRLSHVQGRHHG